MFFNKLNKDNKKTIKDTVFSIICILAKHRYGNPF